MMHLGLSLSLTGGLHLLEHDRADLARGLDNLGAGLPEGGDLVRGGTLSSRDDGTGVSHAAAGGSGTSSDEGGDGLGVGALVVLGEVGSGLLLHRSTDLSDQNDTLSLGVLEEDLDDVNVLGAGEGVTTDTDGERLSEAGEGGLAGDCQLWLRVMKAAFQSTAYRRGRLVAVHSGQKRGCHRDRTTPTLRSHARGVHRSMPQLLT